MLKSVTRTSLPLNRVLAYTSALPLICVDIFPLDMSTTGGILQEISLQPSLSLVHVPSIPRTQQLISVLSRIHSYYLSVEPHFGTRS